MVTVEDVKKLKVQELRDELELRGLDTSGLKAALVERLEAAIASDGGASTAATNGINGAGTTSEPAQAAPAADAPAAHTKGGQPITFTASTEAVKAAAPTPAAEGSKAEGAAAERAGSGKTPIPIPEAAAAAKDIAEKRKARAERFGVVEPLPEADKKKQRSEKLGGAEKAEGAKTAPGKQAKAAAATEGQEAAGAGSDKPKAGISKPVLTAAEKLAELDKKKERAKRFNLPVPVTKEDVMLRKAARLERFKSDRASAAAGSDAVDKASGADKTKQQTERIAHPAKEGPKEGGKRGAPQAGASAAASSAAAADFEAKKKARAERFALAAK